MKHGYTSVCADVADFATQLNCNFFTFVVGTQRPVYWFVKKYVHLQMTAKVYVVSAVFRHYNCYKAFSGRVHLQALRETNLRTLAFSNNTSTTRVVSVANQKSCSSLANTHPHTRTHTKTLGLLLKINVTMVGLFATKSWSKFFASTAHCRSHWMHY